MRWQSIRIPQAAGSSLQAILHGGLGRVMAVQCHRLGDVPGNPEARLLAACCGRSRLPLLQLWFAGHGHSPGRLAASTYSNQMAQLAASLDYLAGRGARQFVLFGAGMGGSVALLCAARDERIVGVATLCAIPRPARHLGGVPAGCTLDPGFAHDAASHDVVAAARVVRAPCLIIHGAQDAQVPPYEAEDLAGALRQASLELVLGADHRMAAPQRLRPAVRRAAGFLQAAAEAALLHGEAGR